MISRRIFITQSATAAAVVVAAPVSYVSASTFSEENYQLKKFGFISGIIDKELKGCS
jgi:hypothetical protein